MLKRLFDIVVSGAALVFALPVIGLLVLAVRRETPGPGLFRQTRIGRNGEPFVCLKLRTMAADAPQLPTHEVASRHVTPLGRRLRRWKLDELPQLWNVLKGEMSFVGPRPCLPSQTALIAERQRLGVFAARPGITGLAQVEGVDMSDPVRLSAIDAQYARRANMALDLGLIFRTFSRRAMSDRTGG